jgi:hypothetical protein
MLTTDTPARTMTDADIDYVRRAAAEWHQRSGSPFDSPTDRARFAQRAADEARDRDSFDVHFPSLYRTWAP